MKFIAPALFAFVVCLAVPALGAAAENPSTLGAPNVNPQVLFNLPFSIGDFIRGIYSLNHVLPQGGTQWNVPSTYHKPSSAYDAVNAWLLEHTGVSLQKAFGWIFAFVVWILKAAAAIVVWIIQTVIEAIHWALQRVKTL